MIAVFMDIISTRLFVIELELRVHWLQRAPARFAESSSPNAHNQLGVWRTRRYKSR